MAVHYEATTGHRIPWNLHWYYHTHHYCCDCLNFQLFQTAHHLQIYQWHYWSFFKDFTIVSRFTDHASSEILQHQEGVPVKLVIPFVTTHLLASKWSLLQTKKYCCFCSLLPNSSHLLLDQVILLHVHKMVFILL